MRIGREGRLYWDSCVFIAWLQDEARAPGEMEGVAEMVRAVDKGQAIIVTSVLTTTEILESKLTDAQCAKLHKVFKRPELQKVACDDRVATKGREIRDYYQRRGQKLLTPDSIHLATAILYDVGSFFTFDGSSGRMKKNAVKLAPLHGDVAGHPLRIYVPMGTVTLLSGVPPTSLSTPTKEKS